MRAFFVTFEGVGYNLYDGNGRKIGGFFISVTVETITPEEAMHLAFEKLVSSTKYQEVINGEQPESTLAVSQCVELLEPDPALNEITGFVFYYPETATNDSPSAH